MGSRSSTNRVQTYVRTREKNMELNINPLAEGKEIG
jgi:hypothetical protein